MKVSTIAERLGLSVEGDARIEIAGVAPLSVAGESDLSFLSNPRYRETAKSSAAGAIVVSGETTLPGHTLLIAGNPYLAFARAIELFHPPRIFEGGIHPTALVGKECSFAPSCHVGPYVVIGDRAVIGEGSVIEAGCVVGRDCVIGERCRLYPRVVLYDDTRLGNEVILHSGVVVGSDGFGFAHDGGRYVKVPQIGRAVVEDSVEIGANSTVDRGALQETRIGGGTKIDNLVQVAHNVRIGHSCILVAQSGISGSTSLGEGVILAGQSGIVGHVTIGDGTRIGAKSAVTKSLPAGSFVTGHPAQPHRKWLKERAMAARLEEIINRLRALESNHADQRVLEKKP